MRFPQLTQQHRCKGLEEYLHAAADDLVHWEMLLRTCRQICGAYGACHFCCDLSRRFGLWAGGIVWDPSLCREHPSPPPNQNGDPLYSKTLKANWGILCSN